MSSRPRARDFYTSWYDRAFWILTKTSSRGSGCWLHLSVLVNTFISLVSHSRGDTHYRSGPGPARQAQELKRHLFIGAGFLIFTFRLCVFFLQVSIVLDSAGKPLVALSERV